MIEINKDKKQMAISRASLQKKLFFEKEKRINSNQSFLFENSKIQQENAKILKYYLKLYNYFFFEFVRFILRSFVLTTNLNFIY